MPAARQFAARMLHHGEFTYATFGDASMAQEFPGVPIQAPPTLRERFDPADDASDTENDDDN